MTEAELRPYVGQKLTCRSPRCVRRGSPTILGLLTDPFRLSTTCTIRSERDDDILCLGRPHPNRPDGPTLIPLTARIRCWHCRDVKDLREIRAQHFA